MSADFADKVRSVLESESEQLAESSRLRWQFSLRNGASHTVTAQVADGWLILAAGVPSHESSADSLWGLAERNAILPGFVKFALNSSRHIELRAELPLVDDVDIQDRFRQACEGLRCGWGAIAPADVGAPGADKSGSALPCPTAPLTLPSPPRGEENTGKLEVQFPLPSEGEDQGEGESAVAVMPRSVAAIDFKQLCEDAGWPLVERGAGRATVPLEASCAPSAVLLRTGHGAHLFVDLGEFDSSLPLFRHAAAAWLLEANHLVRMARATVVPNNGASSAVLEVQFSAVPRLHEWDAALSSLSTAYDMVSDGIQALRSAEVATEFLSARGWTADAETPDTTQQKGNTQ